MPDPHRQSTISPATTSDQAGTTALLLHELKTSLTIINTTADLLANPLSSALLDPVSADQLRQLQAHARYMQALLHAHADPRLRESEGVRPADALDDIAELLGPVFRQHDISLITGAITGGQPGGESHGSPLLAIGPLAFRQLVINILLNALHACRSGGGHGAPTVNIHPPRLRQRWWRLAIDDNGPGLDGPPDRPGGLGCPLIRSLTARAGGKVIWTHRPPTGCRVVLILPLAAPYGHLRPPAADAPGGAAIDHT